MDKLIGDSYAGWTPGGLESRAATYAREAGRIVMDHYRGPLDITYKPKGLRNPVTDVDKEVESFLRAAIARDFPGHGILGEEGTGSGDEQMDYWWVLDPIDGTTNYVNGLPFFGVSIGVLHHRRPVAAAIFASVTQLGAEGVFHAASGKGAYLDGVPLQVAEEKEPSPGRLVSVPGGYGRGFKLDKELRKRHGEPRVMGSIALEMALTAGGTFQSALFGGPKIWDVAAGVLIVREAGGTVMVGNRQTGVWEKFDTFASGETDPAKQAENLRKWSRPIIAGCPEVTGFLAQHLTIRARRVARGRSDSSPAAGKPDSG